MEWERRWVLYLPVQWDTFLNFLVELVPRAVFLRWHTMRVTHVDCISLVPRSCSRKKMWSEYEVIVIHVWLKHVEASQHYWVPLLLYAYGFPEAGWVADCSCGAFVMFLCVQSWKVWLSPRRQLTGGAWEPSCLRSSLARWWGYTLHWAIGLISLVNYPPPFSFPPRR